MIFSAKLKLQSVATWNWELTGMALCEQLKSAIDGHFKRYPHLSINALAKKSGVGATTIRRIVTSSIKGDPAPHTVLNLMSAITNEKRLGNLVKMVEGELGDYLREHFGAFMETQATHKYDVDLNHSLKNPIKYFIYKLCANRQGPDRSQIEALFGSMGLKELDELQKIGLVSEAEDGRLHAKEKNFSLDLEVAASHLPELVKFYKPQRLGDGRNLFYGLSESLNQAGIDQIKKIQKEAVKNIFNIMSSQDYQGDIAYFTLCLSDTMDFDRGQHQAWSQGVLQ